MTYVVGLTGGIGSGKSAVSGMFEKLGVDVIDTDIISRALTAGDGKAMPAIRARFGEAYVTSQGALDRARMRDLAFGDARARHELEAILHPLIREEVDWRVRDAQSPYVLVVVPLLIETGSYRLHVNRVLVVDCEEKVQIERVMSRNALDEPAVRAIMATQVTRAERLAGADDVIENNAGLDSLAADVDRLHERYLSLAAHA